MRNLDSEPDWDTQDCVGLHFENSQWERFSSKTGEIFAHVTLCESGASGWVSLTKDEWNAQVDDAPEVYGTNLYL